MNGSDEIRRAEQLASDLLKLARSEIAAALRFLDTALFRLKDEESDVSRFEVDGEKIRYSTAHVLRLAAEEEELLPRDLLHMLFHCLFSHPFRGGRVDPLRYDLACDIAAENTINELELPFLTCRRQYRQDKVIEEIKKRVAPVTAEKVYRLLLQSPLSDGELLAIREDFEADDHDGWYEPALTAADGVPGRDGGEEKDRRRLQERPSAGRWLETGRAVALDMELFSADWGTKAGTLRRTLASLRRETVSFRDFLRRFAVSDESLSVSDDEFDYIFYTYGLSLYGNMPLIEPLEYREEPKIGDIVLAVDTSASISPGLARQFLEYVFGILFEEKIFAASFRLLLIECDTEIRAETFFTSKAELTAAAEKMTWIGGGGTDFRPVFGRVNELLAEGAFTDLRGLLYFTDGRGVFPAEKPGYDTAFILVESEAAPPAVPPWAMKVVIDEKEVRVV